MLVRALTISDKGQIVIPKEFVKHLGTKMVKLEISNDSQVRIVPLKDVAGSLTSFAKKPTTDDFNDLRNQAWNQEALEKFSKV